MITAASQHHSNTNCSIPPQPGHAWWSEGFPVVFHSFVLSCSEKAGDTASLWQCKLSASGLDLSASSCLCPAPPLAKGSALILSQQQASAYCFWWLTLKYWQQQEGFKKSTTLSTCIRLHLLLSFTPTNSSACNCTGGLCFLPLQRERHARQRLTRPRLNLCPHGPKKIEDLREACRASQLCSAGGTGRM